MASRNRPLRLRWLLNALAEQTLPRHSFEVIVGHDSVESETRDLLATHPLAGTGVLRAVAVPRGSASPGRTRNAAWRSARAPVIAFTGDDCRPPPEWLKHALSAATRHSGAIVQGSTRPDPEEHKISLYAPYVTTESIDPPQPWGQACNIIYPVEILERLGGFPEDMCGGEDTALAQCARDAGVSYVGAAEVLTSHAVEEAPLILQALDGRRLRELPLLLRRHPRLREEFPLRLFWKREHLWLPAALTGIALRRRSPLWGLLAVPYLLQATPRRYGTNPRGRVRGLFDVPALALVHATEIASLAWGSIRHRTLFL